MRLPFQQVAMELIEVVAPELAVTLDWTEEGAGWGIIHLHKWALARCPDSSPPSANDVVHGPHAAKLLARAARYTGDPEAFVTACENATYPLLERVEGGIRIRGLDRYDDAWAGAQTRSGKARLAAEVRWGKQRKDAQPDARTMLGACSVDAQAHARPMLGDAYTQTQTHTQIQKEEKQPTPPAAADSVGGSEAVQQLKGLWNSEAHPKLPRWKATSKGRTKAAVQALKRRPIEGEEGWREVLRRISAYPFCLGKNDREWVADPDWWLRPEGKKPETAAMVLEKYPAAPAQAPPKRADIETPHGRAWDGVLDELWRDGKRYAHEWLSKLRPIAIRSNVLELGCPDDYFRDWVEDQYGLAIRGIADSQGFEVQFTIHTQDAHEEAA